MLYILWGEDDFSLQEKVQEIKNELGEMSLLATNTNVLDGQKLSLNELKAVGEAAPFLAAKRLVIIKGLLERYEPKDKTGRAKKSNAGGAKAEETQTLADSLKSFPESTVAVLIDHLDVKGSSLKNNPLFESLAGKAQVISFPTLRGIKLTQWIQSRVNRLGGSISQQATNLMVELIGGDLYTMLNEISKLVAYTAGRMIEEKDVRMLVSAAQEAEIFSIVDAIMDHKMGLAEQTLHKLLQNGVVPPQILALIARQIQILLQLKELKGLKRPNSEIQMKLGITSPYTWNKISSRSEGYTLQRLQDIYRSLLEADLSIKTGKFDGDLALNLLIAELC